MSLPVIVASASLSLLLPYSLHIADQGNYGTHHACIIESDLPTLMRDFGTTY
jgi:hypothetical protein